MSVTRVLVSVVLVVVLVHVASAAVRDEIDNHLNSYPVVVYSKSYCPYCMKTKALLARLGVNAKVVELDQAGATGAEMQHVLTETHGQRTVPYVFIGGRLLGGNDKTQAAFHSGELHKLLSDVGVSVNKEEL
eukprot:EC715281.1.p1 GENE.EC715281.1~~EC715281.1.p1  ORF type:complete len:132 (+),score=8.89 EC715281.1:15-410(+)